MESSNFNTSSVRDMASLKEQYEEWMKKLQQYCYNQDWKKSGGLIQWNAIAICEMSKSSWHGKTPYERRFGEPFKGPIIRFGAMAEYHPISLRDQSRLHQFGKKVLPGIFFWLWADRGWNMEGGILIGDLEDLEKMGASEN